MKSQTTEIKNTKIHYQIETQRLRLVPYARRYIEEYHNWFVLDPELLYLTGSEPLTLEQQYQNHRSWLQDPQKYTFLILKKSDNKLIGDINLFFSPWIQPNQSQINIMIAQKKYRGLGYASQAITAIQKFSNGIYHRNTIIAKIKSDNLGSIKLFQKIGYQFVNENVGFSQMEYRKIVQGSWGDSLEDLRAGAGGGIRVVDGSELV